MTRTQMIVVGLLALAAGAGSFVVGRSLDQTPPARHAARTCPAGLGTACNDCNALATCLGLSPSEAREMAEADPDFNGQAATLRADLAEQRDALAGLLEAPDSSDETLTRQVERVIAAHDALERRVARHVLAIRKHLTPSQAKRLMGLLAEGVRSAGKPCRRRSSTGSGQRQPCCLESSNE